MSKVTRSQHRSSTVPQGRRNVDVGLVFAAMADPTRRAILTRLAASPATVGELAEPFDISLPAVSKHLKVLEQAGLLEREIVGRVHHCRAVLEPLRAAEAWMAQRQAFWDKGLESLRSFLNERPSALPREAGRTPPGMIEAGDSGGTTTDTALAIVRRDPDGEWRIERLIE
jgi:DNA-binding transcriptional ArsR family regulator